MEVGGCVGDMWSWGLSEGGGVVCEEGEVNVGSCEPAVVGTVRVLGGSV